MGPRKADLRQQKLGRGVCIVSALALTLACGQVTPGPARPGEATPTAPTPSPSPSRVPSATGQTVIAIEYAVPGLAEAYAPTGVTYAKLQPAYGVWGLLEPEPGRYNWAPLDTLIAEYQAAGFAGIQLLLTAESPWAAVRPPTLGDKGDSMPREEHLDDYAAFVRRVVERYDGDGVDDAPGLLHPVHHYGVEREFTGFWPSGDAEDYVRLLRIAYPEIKAADPEARVLLVALLMADVFDSAPEPEVVERRLDQAPLLGYSREAMEHLLAACDAYDVVDFHSLGDYTEIPPTVAWLRAELDANGCGVRPIWIGDAFSMSALVGYADPLGLTRGRTFAPATDEDQGAVVALLESVADPEAADHAAATAWLRAEMARGLVKKIVVSAGAGLAGINVGNLEDWSFGDVSAVNVGLVRSAGTSIFMGMMDRTLTNRHAGAPLKGLADPISKIRRPGELRAAFYALQLVAGRVGGYTAVQRLELGAGVWAYRFERVDDPFWVVWYDDGDLHLPSDSPPVVAVDLDVGEERARVARAPTVAEPARWEGVEVSGGVLQLTVDATPLFVEVGE
jgi:hypothetical protein